MIKSFFEADIEDILDSIMNLDIGENISYWSNDGDDGTFDFERYRDYMSVYGDFVEIFQVNFDPVNVRKILEQMKRWT
jgi:hypothetical protein